MPGAADATAGQVFATVRGRVLTMHPGDEEGWMLRCPALRTGGRSYAFATATDLIVKLPALRVVELVGSGQGLPCATRPGRPMREWVRITAPDEDTCLTYVLEGRDFVAGQP